MKESYEIYLSLYSFQHSEVTEIWDHTLILGHLTTLRHYENAISYFLQAKPELYKLPRFFFCVNSNSIWDGGSLANCNKARLL